MEELLMKGAGCKTCPVKDCDTSVYRGSRCAALRHQAGTYRDPRTNFEAFKEMFQRFNVEQMARFILEYKWICEDCPEYEGYLRSSCSRECTRHCKEWLELPEDPGIEVSS